MQPKRPLSGCGPLSRGVVVQDRTASVCEASADFAHAFCVALGAAFANALAFIAIATLIFCLRAAMDSEPRSVCNSIYVAILSLNQQ